MNWNKRGPWTTVEECVLDNMGISSTGVINSWYMKARNGQYRIDGIEEVLDLIDSRAWDKIHIVGDYDADGCTSTAEARLVLKTLGYPVSDRIPRRFSEGYGLNVGIIDEIPDGNVLLITVDNGIAALDAVQRAKERGFTVVIVDHHQPVIDEEGNKHLPNADIIIDPWAIDGSAEFNGYCGAGLMYRLMTALLDRKLADIPETDNATIGRLKWLKIACLTFAMIGTIADQMDLVEENYVIVREGLKRLAKGQTTTGLQILCKKNFINLDPTGKSIVKPTETDVEFKLGPCINANGRIFDTGSETSVDLLTCNNEKQAWGLAFKTCETNENRKQMAREGREKAFEIVESRHMEKDFPLVLYLPDINEGVVGIIASGLQERYGSAVILFTDSSTPGVLKGSGRSVDGYNMKAALDETRDFWVRYGGHPGAAGVSVKASDLEAARQALMKNASAMGLKAEIAEENLYDLEIKAEDAASVLNETLKFAPFGNGNRPLIFKITDFQPLLNEKGHFAAELGTSTIKLIGKGIEAIGFNMTNRLDEINGAPMTLYGKLSYHEFRGVISVQVEMLDFECAKPVARIRTRESLHDRLVTIAASGQEAYCR